MSTWVTDEKAYNNGRILLDQLVEVKFISELTKDKKRNFNFLISENKKIETKIHWELWPNGQNFKVIEWLQ